MASEHITTPPSSQPIRNDIERLYLESKESYVYYNRAARIKIGNQKVYWSNFVTEFENLFLSTSTDPIIKKEEYNGQPLVAQVQAWLANGKRDISLGLELYRAYVSALFSRNILSIRGGPNG
jgi:hypothetical protein